MHTLTFISRVPVQYAGIWRFVVLCWQQKRRWGLCWFLLCVDFSDIYVTLKIITHFNWSYEKKKNVNQTNKCNRKSIILYQWHQNISKNASILLQEMRKCTRRRRWHRQKHNPTAKISKPISSHVEQDSDIMYYNYTNEHSIFITIPTPEEVAWSTISCTSVPILNFPVNVSTI